MQAGAKEARAFEACPSEGVQPDAIDEPVDYGEQCKGPDSEASGGGSEGEADGRPPEQEVGISGGEYYTRPDGVFINGFLLRCVGASKGGEHLGGHQEEDYSADRTDYYLGDGRFQDDVEAEHDEDHQRKFDDAVADRQCEAGVAVSGACCDCGGGNGPGLSGAGEGYDEDLD